MPHDSPIRGPAAHRPLRPTRTVRPARIKPQPGDDEENVVASRINGDPIASPTLAIMTKPERSRRSIQQPCRFQDKRRSARAVVRGIKIRGAMPRAINIRKPGNAVGSRHRNLDIGRSSGRRNRITVTHDSSPPRDIMVNVRRRLRAACQQKEDRAECNESREDRVQVDGWF